MRELKNNFLVIVVLTFFASILYRGLFDSQTVTGFIYDWGYSIGRNLEAWNRYAYAWNQIGFTGVGELKLQAYFHLISAFFTWVGLSGSVFYKCAVLFLSVFSGYSWWTFSIKEIKPQHKVSALLGALFYMSSSFFAIRYVVGYFGYFLAASFFPLLLMNYFAYVRQGKNLHLVMAVLASLLTFYQPQFVAFFLLFVLVEIMSVFLKIKKQTTFALKGVVLIILGYVLANLFWIVPFFQQIKKTTGISSFSNIAFSSRIESLPHTLWNALLLTDQAAVLDGTIAAHFSLPRLLSLFFFLIVLFFLAFQSKNKKILAKFFLIASLVLPLLAGTGHIFSRIYTHLFYSLPGSALFREIYHFEYLLLIFYSVCVVLAVDKAILLLHKKTKLLYVYTVIFFLFGIINFNLLSFDTHFLGYGGSAKVSDNLLSADSTIQTLTSGLIFYPPGMNFWKLKNDKRIGVNYPDQLATSYSNLSVNQGSSDLELRDDSIKLRNATVNAFMNKDQSFLELLPYLGSNTIVDRTELESHYYESVEIQKRRRSLRETWLGESNSQKIAAWPSLHKTVINPTVSAYTLPTTKDSVYISHSPTVICNYSDVNSDIDSFFYNQHSEIEEKYASNSCKDGWEILAQQKEPVNFGSLGTLKHSADLGWSPGDLSFYETMVFSQTMRDFIFTRVSDSFQVDIPGKEDNLIIKYYSSMRAGKMLFQTVENGVVKNKLVDAYDKNDSEKWVYLVVPYKELGGKTLTVKSLEGENAIGAIFYASDLDLTQKDFKINNKSSNSLLGDAHIDYKRINPTQVTINVSKGNDKPKLVIFSEKFNPDWTLKIGTKEIYSQKINTYANGFLIPGDFEGEGVIEFKGQKSYRFLQIISGFFILFLFFVGLKKVVVEKKLVTPS